jgi:hypothetical protein
MLTSIPFPASGESPGEHVVMWFKSTERDDGKTPERAWLTVS